MLSSSRLYANGRRYLCHNACSQIEVFIFDISSTLQDHTLLLNYFVCSSQTSSKLQNGKRALNFCRPEQFFLPSPVSAAESAKVPSRFSWPVLDQTLPTLRKNFTNRGVYGSNLSHSFLPPPQSSADSRLLRASSFRSVLFDRRT